MKNQSFQQPHRTTWTASWQPWRVLLCLGFVIAFCNTHLTAQNYQVDNSEPYELVIPNLKVLHTNIVFSKEDEVQKTVFRKEGQEHILIGDTITVDTLIYYIKTSDILTQTEVSKIADSLLYRDVYEPKIRNLKIYCSVFIVNKPLWLPEMNVSIHAENVIFNNGLALKTDPRPWRADELLKVAKDGLKAGNINITCDIGTNINVLANGSASTGVQFTNVTFDPPKIYSGTIDVYRCYPHLNERYGDCKFEYKGFKKEDESKDLMVGLIFTNTDKRCAAADRGPTMYPVNGDFEYNASTQTIVDKNADKRLFFEHRERGKGGEAGTISVNAGRSYSYTFSSKTGFIGPYYKPATTLNNGAAELKYVGEAHISGSIALTQKTYYKIWTADNYQAAYIPTLCDDFGVKNIKLKDYVYFSSTNTKSRENNWKKFEDQYKSYSYYQQSHSSGYSSTSAKRFSPSVVYLKHKLLLEQRRIKDYQNLTKEEQAEILNRLAALETQLAKLVGNLAEDLKNTGGGDQAAKDFITFRLNEVKALTNDLNLAKRNLNAGYFDEFNNPLGYRPVLSFSAVKRLTDASIAQDLALYINADDVMKNVGDRQKLKASIPQLIKGITTALNKCDTLLRDNGKRINDLGIEGASLASESDTLNKKLTAVEKELAEYAKQKAKDEKWARIGGKTLATIAACGATAAGGPAAGAFAYTMVDKVGTVLADKGFQKGTSNSVAQRENVNIVPLLEGVRKDKIAPVQKEVADLVYRKNKLFEGFKEWTVDTTNGGNYITTKLPESVEQYKKKKDDLEGKIAARNKFNEKWNTGIQFAIKGGEEMYNILVSTEYLNNAIDRVINESAGYKEIGEKIKYNAYENGKFATKLREELLKKADIFQKMKDLSGKRYEINQILQNEEAYVDPLLANSISFIKTQSLERLKWMEYQMIKVYNYTTLTPYPTNAAASYRNLFSDELNSMVDMDKKIARMREIYDNRMNDIKDKILQNATNSHSQDKSGEQYGAKITIRDSTAIAALNAEKSYAIDLYNDFTDEVIKPKQNNIRIISFTLEDFELSRPLVGDERIDLHVTFDDKGVLRKDSSFYLFVDEPNSLMQWDCTLSATKKGAGKQAYKSTESVNSDIYKEMLNYLIDKSKTGDLNLFTLKPAWSKIYLTARIENVQKANGDLKIKNLRFNVKRDYENVTADQNVCDLRVNSKDTDVRLVVKRTDRKGADTISHSQYNVFSGKTNFQLEAYSIDTNRKFSHWETSPSSLADSFATGNTMNFNVGTKNSDNYRIKPVFVSLTQEELAQKANSNSPILKNTPTSAPTSAPMRATNGLIGLYKEANLSTEVAFKVPMEYLMKLERQACKEEGFLKVFYGYEEYFVSKKDIE